VERKFSRKTYDCVSLAHDSERDLASTRADDRHHGGEIGGSQG